MRNGVVRLQWNRLTAASAVGHGWLYTLPSDSVGVLENIRSKFSRAWTPYGFVNALNPLTGRYDPYVVGIGHWHYVIDG
jgi:hypothetical protein